MLQCIVNRCILVITIATTKTIKIVNVSNSNNNSICRFGLVLMHWSRNSLSSGPVSIWMGDHLQVSKPSRCVTSHSDQLSLAISLWVGAVSMVPEKAGCKQLLESRGLITRKSYDYLTM